MSQYASLSRAQLTYEYLHTNSTTHEFLFGALAELVDNSRDAGSTEMRIFTVVREEYRGGFLLCFLDNGCGMDPTEVSQVIQFGRSSKREAGADHVGQYGNGLKSGSMRIGKDMILFTKKKDTMSCLFLSRTFHEREDIHEVIVPMPSWDVKSRKAHLPEGHTIERHEVEVEIILRYSPFNTLEDLLSNFDNISSESGTNVMLYNLKLMDNSLPELDINKNSHDIIMADPHQGEIYDIHENVLPQRVSFREYLSILYCEPRMKIFVQNELVRTKKLQHCLYKPRAYIYTSNRFKTRSELEAAAAEKQAKNAEERAKELTTQAREANEKYNLSTKEGRHAIQVAVAKADQAKFDAEMKKRVAAAKRKSSKEPKTLTFTFGFNIHRRRLDGIFIYNCNRLIRMYEKVGPQTEGDVKCAGIVGVVDVPYLVLEPTHNKQDFADQKEFKHLLKSMGEHMLQYWKDSKVENTGTTKFWDDFGYSGSWKDDPSDDMKYKMKRLMSVPTLLQCSSCLKWRQLNFSRKMINYEVDVEWTCSKNPEPQFANCNKTEQKLVIPTGRLLKDIRNLNEKREEEVRKLQEKLDQKQTELRKRKPKSPSPKPEPSPPRRRRKSPSPEPEPKGKKGKPSSPPSRGRKAKSPSPSPPPPTRGRKAKSPSPPPKKKKAKSPSPPPARGRKAKSPSPPPARGRKAKSPPAREARKKKSPSPQPKLTRKAKSPSPPPKKTKKQKSPSPPPKANKRALKSPSPQPAKNKKQAPSPAPVKQGRKTKSPSPVKSPSPPPVRRGRRIKSPSPSPEKESTPEEPEPELEKGKQKANGATVAADEIVEAPKKKKGPKAKEIVEDVPEVIEEVISKIYPPNTKVEAKMHNTWYSGTIVASKKSGENATLRVRVKFDKHVDDRFDKWFYETDPTLRLCDKTDCEASNNHVEDSNATNVLEPSELSQDVKGELLEKVTYLLRRSLCYFRAPDFEKDKREILSLTPQQLRDFPLTTFFDDYERNIKKQLQATRENLNRRADEAEKRCEEVKAENSRLEKELNVAKENATENQKTLNELRLGVNVMLRSILNEDEKLDPSDTSENVDIYLKTIVDQISESTEPSTT